MRFFFLLEGDEESGGSHLLRWEVVSKLVDHGVLRIGNLRLYDESPLAKWLRSFLLEPDPL